MRRRWHNGSNLYGKPGKKYKMIDELNLAGFV